MANQLQEFLSGLEPTGSGLTGLPVASCYIEPPDVPVGMTFAEYRRRRVATRSRGRRLSAGLRASLTKVASELI